MADNTPPAAKKSRPAENQDASSSYQQLDQSNLSIVVFHEKKLIFSTVWMGVSDSAVFIFTLENSVMKSILELPQYNYVRFAQALLEVAEYLRKPRTGEASKTIQCNQRKDTNWFKILAEENVSLANKSFSIPLTVENLICLAENISSGILRSLSVPWEELQAIYKVAICLKDKDPKEGDRLMESLGNMEMYESLPISNTHYKTIFFNHAVVDAYFIISKCHNLLHQHLMRA